MPGVIYMKVEQGKKYNIDQYPNFHYTGSIKGMKKMYYGKNACLIRCGQYIYKVPPEMYYKYRYGEGWRDMV